MTGYKNKAKFGVHKAPIEMLNTQQISRGFAALAICIGLSSCASVEIPAQLPGYWASDGYGRVLAVTENNLEVFDFARNTCVKTPDTTIELRSILSSSQLEFSNDAQNLDLVFANEPYKLRFNRLTELPSPCATLGNNRENKGPQHTFDAFTNYFAEHYAFFELFGVDWEQRTAAARTQVTDETSDQALFDLFSDLLEPLQDAHINLYATVGGTEQTYGPEQSPVRAALDAQATAQQVPVAQLQLALLESLWDGNIGEKILAGKGTYAANDHIQYGVVAKDDAKNVPKNALKTRGTNIGYLAVRREGDYGRVGTDLDVLNQVLDAAITQWQDAKVAGVVIDISVNFGGNDYLGRAIANRFAKQRTLAYRKRAADRADAEDFELYLEPHQGLTFTGPVTLVTSTSTVSAGEILAMSLRSLPQVTHLGEPTRGSLSDMLDKTLPNGWVITLSNEIYTDHQGNLWEGPGITPHLSLSVLDPQDPVASHLQAIKTAIALTSQ